MKMQNKEIVDFLNTCVSMKKKSLPVRLAYAIKKNVVAVQEAASAYTAEREELIRRYAKKDENGEIMISGVTGTIVVKETQTIPGYTIDPAGQSQTVVVNPADTQTLTFYNQPIGGVEIIKVNEADRTERIPNTTFEIRKVDDELIDTVTTGKDGRVFVSLEDGAYYAVETEAAEGFQVDPTPHYFEVEDGKTVSLTVTNKAFSGILIHKVDADTREGIYGVTFLLYDANNNPVGQYTSDNQGYVYIENIETGRYYLRELENEGYILDTQRKTVYVKSGETTLVEWENTPIMGQIQIIKKSADDNPINALPAGTLLEGAVFEVYDKAGNVVDTIVSDYNGRAVSKLLPLGRYTIREVQAPDYYSINPTVLTAYLDYEGQIVTFEVEDNSVSTGVSIKKTGYAEVMPNQPIRYTITGIGNTSTVPLSSLKPPTCRWTVSTGETRCPVRCSFPRWLPAPTTSSSPTRSSTRPI